MPDRDETVKNGLDFMAADSRQHVHALRMPGSPSFTIQAMRLGHHAGAARAPTTLISTVVPFSDDTAESDASISRVSAPITALP